MVVLQNNIAQLYDAESHERVGDEIESVDSPILSAAFSPDSQRLALGTFAGRVLQWDLEANRQIEPDLEGDVGAIAGVGYSPDGELLATSRLGFSTTQLWRTDTGAEYGGTFVGGRMPFTDRTFEIDSFRGSRPAFSPDGGRLVTPGFEHGTVSWTLDPEDWRRAACSIAGRELTDDEWRQYLPSDEPHDLCGGT